MAKTGLRCTLHAARITNIEVNLMLRLFIGIPLENKAQEQLTGFYSKFSGIKTVKKENLHVTMQFLGDIEEDQLDAIKAAMDKACAGFYAFEITCTRCSAFPSQRKAKAVWVNVDKGASQVRKLFRDLDKCLAGIKYEKEERAFIPHVTIGRTKQAVDITAQAAELKFEIKSNAGKITLFSSVLDPSGPVYSRLYERSLEVKV